MTTHPAFRVGTSTVVGLRLTLLIFLALIFPLFVVIGMLAAGLGDNDTSMWQNASAGAIKYFSLAIAIRLTAVFLPIYVANGVTRHQVSAGGALFIAIWSGIMTIAIIAGYLIEAPIYRALGAEQTFDVPHLFSSLTDVHLMVAENFLLVSVHMVAGWLIGTTYYRYGWFVPTLLLPITLVPVAVVEVLLGTSWVGAGLVEFSSYTRPPLAIAVPAAALTIAITWAVNLLLIRDIPIRLKTG